MLIEINWDVGQNDCVCMCIMIFSCVVNCFCLINCKCRGLLQTLWRPPTVVLHAFDECNVCGIGFNPKTWSGEALSVGHSSNIKTGMFSRNFDNVLHGLF